MRRLKITHLTEYQYASSVRLQPHRLLLRPREGPDVHIESSSLLIFPEHSIKWHRDVFDNAAAIVDFRVPTQTLTITSEVIIQHFDENPLDFLIEEYAVDYPFTYASRELVELQPFLHPVYPDDSAAILEWLKQIGLVNAHMQTYSLLDLLNRAVAGQFMYMVREEPGVQSPAQTLGFRSGSCRDFAALFVEASRQLGMASRFVSGYSHLPASEIWSTTTHAWAEIYLPGAGWKGFDPTSGEMSGGRHISVAVARHPEDVPPVSGSFWGDGGPSPAPIVDVRVVAV